MAKLTVPSILSNIPSFQDFQRFASALVNQLTQIINGNLNFKDNFKSSGPFTVAFPNGSTVMPVTHTLGIIPTGVLVIKLDSGQTIYAPSQSTYDWTTSTIYLQASGKVNATIYVI